jgi:hypothetical protein
MGVSTRAKNSKLDLYHPSPREELSDAFASENLRSYADSVVENCYQRAKQDAAEETGLAESVFPETSPYTAAQWVALPVPELGDSA